MGNNKTGGFMRAGLWVALAASTGCPSHQLFVALADKRAVPAWYETGDIVDLVAREIIIEGGNEPDPPSSTEAPDRYQWKSSNPLIVAVLSRGRLRMLDTGQAFITVTSPATSTNVSVNVMPRISTLRLTPDSTAIGIGESATLLIEPLDATGQVIQAYSVTALPPPHGRGARLLALKTVGPSGVVSTAPPVGYDQWSAVGLTRGTVRLAAFTSLFNGARLGDTAKVVVR